MNPKQSYLNNLTKGYTPSLTNIRSTPTKQPPKPVLQSATQGDRSKLTLGTAQPSAAWKDFSKNLAVGPGGFKPAMGPIKPTATPANVSATGTTPTSLPPAGKTFAQNQMAAPDTSKLDSIQQGLLSVQQQLQAGTGTATTPKKEESEYLKYLRTMFNPEEAKTAQANVNALNKQIADETARTRKEQERIAKNEAGMLERGQTYLSTVEGRDSAKALADLAIAKGYSTDILNQYLNAGKSIYDAEEAMRKESEAPLTLEEAESLGVPFGTTMAEARLKGIVPGGTTTAGYTKGADPVIDSWVNFVNGGGDISKVPDKYKNKVVQGLTTTGPGTASPYQQERALRTIQSVDSLMSRVSPWTTGFGSLLSKIPATDARDFQADLNTLKSSVAFSELTAMREASKTGGALGAISDKELILLESALGALDAGQSAANLQKNLQQIKDSISRWQQAVNQYGGAGGTMGGNEAGNPLFDF